MKTTLILASLMFCSIGLFAQVEHDDMYFKKHDRKNLKHKREEAARARLEKIAKGENNLRFDQSINYNNKVADQLAHSINPEYLSRTGADDGENPEYYFSNYRYNANFNTNFTNLNIASIYGSSWYYDMYFSPYMNPWRNPYQNVFMYDQFYNPYRNRWMNPFYSNGWYNVSLMSCYVSSGSWSWNQSMSNPFGMFHNQYPNSYVYPSTAFNDDQVGSSMQRERSSRSQNVELAQTAFNRNSRVFNTHRNDAMASSKTTNTRKTRTTALEYYTPQWKRVTQQSLENTVNTDNYPSSKMSSPENRSFSTNRSSSNSLNQRSTAAPSQSSSSPASSNTSRSSSSGGSPSRSSRGSN